MSAATAKKLSVVIPFLNEQENLPVLYERLIGALDGQPDLAVLLVRESDRLPGQGWWVGGTALLLGYDGPWEGAAAARFIREQQQAVFDFWAER